VDSKSPNNVALTADDYDARHSGRFVASFLDGHTDWTTTKDCLVPGLMSKFYSDVTEGSTGDSTPMVMNGTPFGEGVMATVANFSGTSDMFPFPAGVTRVGTELGVEWTGVLVTPVAGDYVFWAESDDACQMWLDRDGDGSFTDAELVINDKGTSPMGAEIVETPVPDPLPVHAGKVTGLAMRGAYPIRILYRDKALENAGMKLSWWKPGASAWETFPANTLLHEE
jgi:prepilin-type processing-associated H-X9-DG protein